MNSFLVPERKSGNCILEGRRHCDLLFPCGRATTNISAQWSLSSHSLSRYWLGSWKASVFWDFYIFECLPFLIIFFIFFYSPITPCVSSHVNPLVGRSLWLYSSLSCLDLGKHIFSPCFWSLLYKKTMHLCMIRIREQTEAKVEKEVTLVPNTWGM